MNVVIGELMSDRLARRGITSTQIRVLPNWADCSALIPVDNAINRLHADWNLSDQFVVGYSGNLGRAHDIETLLTAIAKLEAGGTRISARPVRWLFIGGGHLFEDMKRAAADRALKSIAFQPYQPRNRLSESLSAADVHIVALRPELEGLIVPSKFYGVAAAGRAAIFIGAPDGEIPRVIARGACGVTIASGDSEALVRAVIFLASDPKRCREMGKRARALCVELYSKTNAIDGWNELLHDVTRPREIRNATQSKLTWT
jgi:glycosyltransferase involved in cell wall biosynthesis